MSKVLITSDKKAPKILSVASKYVIQIPFDEVFKNDDLKDLNKFILKKKRAYDNVANLYCDYINHFIEYYDYDNELLLAYIKIKFMIDRKSKYSKKAFVNDLYEFLLTDSMVEKIEALTEDNYMINLDKFSANQGKLNESLQFTNEHGKILMNISMAMKIFIPLMTHYAHVYSVKNMDKFILKCFDRIGSYFEGENDIYNKLYETVTSRINETRGPDKRHWLRVEIEGDDPLNQIDNIVNKLYINIIHKYIYNDNMIFLNHASIKKSISNIRRTKSKLNYKPITNKRDADGLVA